MVRLIIKVFFQDMRKVQVGEETTYNTTRPVMMMGTYLWHKLQVHNVTEKFKLAGFNSHPEFSPYVVKHFLNNELKDTLN